jgi:hypothetical protein
MRDSLSYKLTESPLSIDDGEANTWRAAVQLFDRAYGEAWRGRRWSALRRRPHHRLCDLELVQAKSAPGNAHYAGLQTVLIRHIRGSESRPKDFDADFRPLESRTGERWLSIARARLQGVTLPPIELMRVGDAYFVRDGHHRRSVARALGEEFIEAQITVWMTKPQPGEGKPSPVPNAFLSQSIKHAHARARTCYWQPAALAAGVEVAMLTGDS